MTEGRAQDRSPAPSANPSLRISLTLKFGADRCEFGVRLGKVFKTVPRAPIPVAAVRGIALDLMKDGVQPVGHRIAFEALGRLMRFVPSPRE